MPDPTAHLWTVYIIITARGRLYTGITTDLTRRFQQHCNGTGAKFFRTDKAEAIAWSEAGHDRSSASRREWAIKRLSRSQKQALINSSTSTVGSS
jgi:putative endonuclease